MDRSSDPITKIKVSPDSLPDALKKACESVKPCLFPLHHHVDDRGWSLMNLMQGVLSPQGQINYSIVYPHTIKAWHRHQHQTDFWLFLHGHAKVGIHDEKTGQSWQAVVGEKKPALIIIPPTLWHGMATVGPDSAGLLYYVTQAYNPQAPDEERRPFDSIAGFDWNVQHR